jgi:predicted anti-sigma-YlaC factor YlaD
MRQSSGNQMGTSDDQNNMACDRWQEALSAVRDGEDPGINARLLAAHVEHCISCQGFTYAIDQLHRSGRLREAEPMPDLSRDIVKLNAITDRASRWGLARALLAVVAVQIMVFSVVDLLRRDSSGTSAHSARHLGAFTMAYGVGLLVVVVRPARARSILPVAAVLAGAMVLTAAVDLLNGRIPLLGEAVHLPEVLSVLLIWLLAVPSPRRTARQAALPDLRAPLRAVDDNSNTG